MNTCSKLINNEGDEIMRFKYVIEVRHNGEVEYPKTSDSIEDLKEWIWKKYPSAVKMPVLPSEYIGGWYVDKYMTHIVNRLTKKGYSPKAFTIYIKKTF
jgi:hypothetical protein